MSSRVRSPFQTLHMPLHATQQTLHCYETMYSVVFVRGVRQPTSTSYYATTACSSGSGAEKRHLSAAISPLKRLRFFVIVFSPTENKSADTADDACTARYLRADLATVGDVLCFPAHHLTLALFPGDHSSQDLRCT